MSVGTLFREKGSKLKSNETTSYKKLVFFYFIAFRFFCKLLHRQRFTKYEYDEIGNLVADSSEGILKSVGGIKWNVYGKIIEINKVDVGSAANNIDRVKKITYTYDASGNRISKKIEKYISGSPIDYTWYVRDAGGNVMSTYNYSIVGTDLSTGSLLQDEVYLYGSSRLGSLKLNRNVELTKQVWDTTYTLGLGLGVAVKSPFNRGIKQYELSNHLQNVLVTISDKKLQHTTDGTTVDYYTADIITANDFYPFGQLMPGRKYSQANTTYRYGFNGKENDNEVKGEGNQQDYGMRIYDSRLGRFLSVDPLTMEYPWNSTYAFAENDVIRNIDLDGLEVKKSTFGNISTTSLFRVASASEIKKQHESLTVTLDKKVLKQLEQKLNSESVSEKRRLSTGMAWFQAFATEGKVGANQNPVLSVSLTENSSKSIIKQNKDGSKYLETTNISKTTEVDVQGSFSKTALNSIKVTTSTTTITQKIVEEGENAVVSLSGTGFSSTTTTNTQNVKLTDDYMINFLSLPDPLRQKVNEAHQTNSEVSERAVKGTVDNFNTGEGNAGEGKWIPGKGKYYTSPAKPKSGNF